MDNPLAARVGPDVGACNFTDKVVSGGTQTLQPGVYCRGLKVTDAAVVFLLIVWLTRYVSLGSILAAMTIPLFVFLQNAFIRPVPDRAPLLTCATAGALLIVFAHRANIERLIQGTVVTPEGQPVPGALVSILDAQWLWRTAVAEVRSRLEDGGPCATSGAR